MASLHTSRVRLASLLLFLCMSCAAAHAQRMVFAHYMLANQDPAAGADPTGEAAILSYQHDIQQAKNIGIDGFALNAGGWSQEPRYILRASEMFEAAYRLHTNFKLFFSADMCCSNSAEDVEDMMRRFANNKRYSAIYFRKDGRFVLTTFAGSKYGPVFWQQIRQDLETGSHPSQLAATALVFAAGISSSAPMPLYFVPAFFWGGELPAAEDVRTGLDAYTHIIDGAFYWGIAGVPGLGHAPDQLPSSEAYAAALHSAHKLYMAPICFQFWGANAQRYYEYSGYAGMRSLWMSAIATTHPEWVEIITWNDFTEGTYVTPTAGERAQPTHRGADGLLPYFIQWYKTGREPVIRKDALFWAYRTQLAQQIQKASKIIHIYGPVADVVYLTANLTAPAVLRVSFGNINTLVKISAGSTDLQIPIIIGQPPHFELLRGTLRLAEADAEDPITAGGQPDLYYSTGSMATKFCCRRSKPAE